MATAAIDMLGTLFDLEKVRAKLEPTWLRRFSFQTWIAHALRDYMALSYAGSYTPLIEVLDASLARLLAKTEISVPKERRIEILQEFSKLEPHEGAREACTVLRSEGWQLIALTNGAEKNTHYLLERAQLLGHFRSIISADSVQRSKPDARVYEKAREKAEGAIWILSAHSWDLAGGIKAGLRGAWVSYEEAEYMDIFPPPEIIASGLREAAHQMVEVEKSGAKEKPRSAKSVTPVAYRPEEPPLSH